MQATFLDGRRETHGGLTLEQMLERADRVTRDPEFESMEVYAEKASSGHYANNREGRRKWAREQAHPKQGLAQTPPKKRRKK